MPQRKCRDAVTTFRPRHIGPPAPHGKLLPMQPSTTLAFDYAGFVAGLKTRIASARLTAARAVNSELVGLYWDIGAAIRAKQAA